MNASSSAAQNAFAEAWNRFWFQPGTARTLTRVRICVGIVALLFHGSLLASISNWTGPTGRLSIQLMKELSINEPLFTWTPMYYLQADSLLMAWQGIACAAAMLMICGYYAQMATIVVWLFSLSWVHRAALVTGPTELVLTSLLGYLIFFQPTKPNDESTSWVHGFIAQLIRVHVAAWYLLAGLTKLSGFEWWSGEAAWLLINRDANVMNLLWLRDSDLVVNLWTQAIVLAQILLPFTFWCRASWFDRTARIASGLIAIAVWASVFVLTGSWEYCGLMAAVSWCLIVSRDSSR